MHFPTGLILVNTIDHAHAGRGLPILINVLVPDTLAHVHVVTFRDGDLVEGEERTCFEVVTMPKIRSVHVMRM